MSGIELNKLQRLVIKIGSSLLVNQDGQLDRDWLSGLAEDIAQRTRHYAKRQLTWFRKHPGIVWGDGDEREKMLERVQIFLKTGG